LWQDLHESPETADRVCSLGEDGGCGWETFSDILQLEHFVQACKHQHTKQCHYWRALPEGEMPGKCLNPCFASGLGFIQEVVWTKRQESKWNERVLRKFSRRVRNPP
jgi:hypothetical protein